jgi:hypothetical protein
MTAAHHRMFGHYNAWANNRLYEAVARLSTRQVHALLTGLVGKAPELDLLIFQRLSGKTGRLISRKLHHLVRRVANLGLCSAGANAAILCIRAS